MDETTAFLILFLSCFAGLVAGVVIGGMLPRHQQNLRIVIALIAAGFLFAAFIVPGLVVPSNVIILASLKLEIAILTAIALRWAILSACFGMIVGVGLSRAIWQVLASLGVAVLVLPVYLFYATQASAMLSIMA